MITALIIVGGMSVASTSFIVAAGWLASRRNPSYALTNEMDFSEFDLEAVHLPSSEKNH